LKSDHNGIEITQHFQQVCPRYNLKSDHNGIEMKIS